MPFDFSYAVRDDYTGNDFNHASNSDGHVTTGQYRVLLPDGRTQIVTYAADHVDGYKADVTYEGEAKEYHPVKSGYNDQRPSYSRYQEKAYVPVTSAPVYEQRIPTYTEAESYYGDGYQTTPSYQPKPSYRPKASYQPKPSYQARPTYGAGY